MQVHGDAVSGACVRALIGGAAIHTAGGTESERVGSQSPPLGNTHVRLD